MLKRTVLVLGLMLGGVASAADRPPAGKRAEARLYMTDEVVLNRLNAINQHEIHAGQLAEVQGSSQAVRDFGDRLVQDHARNDRELSTLAYEQGINLKGAKSPNLPMAVRRDLDRQMKGMDKLARLSGPAFDGQFLTDMEQGHLDALAFLREAEAGTQSDPIRAFITRTIPTIEQHRQLAADLKSGQIPNTASLNPSVNAPTMSGAGAYSCPPPAP